MGNKSLLNETFTDGHRIGKSELVEDTQQIDETELNKIFKRDLRLASNWEALKKVPALLNNRIYYAPVKMGVVQTLWEGFDLFKMLQGQNDREALNKVVRDANSSTPKNKIIEMYICNRLSCYCLDKFITKVKKEMPEITEAVFFWEPISIAMFVRFRTPNFNFCIYSGRFDDKTSVMNDSVASFTRYGFYTYLEKNTDKGDIVRLTKSVRKTISELTVEYIKSMFAKQAEKK